MKAESKKTVKTKHTRPSDFVPSRPLLRDIDGPLYEVLSRGFPDYLNRNGGFDWRQLASQLGISSQAMHKSLVNNRISGARAKQIIELSEGRLKKSHLFDFVFT